MNAPLTLGVLEDARYVAERARHVAVVPEAVEAAAADFAARQVSVPVWNTELHFEGSPERTANYLLVLDGLNFSFWGTPRWSLTYRGAERRGYWALAAALKRAIEEGTPVDDARFMAECSLSTLRHVLRGNVEVPLIEARLAHLNELGRRLLDSYEGSFAKAIEAAGGSAVALTQLLVRDFPCFDDASPYAGRTIKIYKRAQILPADLYGAFGGEGLGAFHDIDQLTAFADYRVPQMLEALGILRYAPALEAAIAEGRELPHHGEEEVEIRALTLWGVELLRQALARHGRSLSAIQVDWILWEASLKLQKPFHLTRTTCY